MVNFALVGAAGYIAPRHLAAIHKTGNRLVAAFDPCDSVGILDQYSTQVNFFTEFERFDRHLERLRRGPEEGRVQFVSICSPNYLHDAHCRQALRIGADAICEKPIVINPWNLDALQEIEREYGKRILNVLQLRLHPKIVELRERIARNKDGKKHDVVLTYVTARGKWYHYSWKGDLNKSGGIATNIGVHFFDMLTWIFGNAVDSRVYFSDQCRTAGFVELERARVSWFLSIDEADIPQQKVLGSGSTFRSITVDGEEIDFTTGFADLHTRVYEEVLAGRGFGIDDVRASIELVHSIRHAPLSVRDEMTHPSLV